MDYIHLNEMEFYGYHGVFPEETKLGQRFRLTVSLAVDLKKAGETDGLEHTVHYGEVYYTCQSVIEGEPKKLLEAVAEKLASEILSTYSLVKGLRLQLIKPDPPIPGHYKSVAVDITRGKFL